MSTYRAVIVGVRPTRPAIRCTGTLGCMGSWRMVPVAQVRSSFEAKVLAARLGSEGILFELRGNVDGIYPVGDVTVLVPEDEATAALEVLGLGHVGAGTVVADEWNDGQVSRPWTSQVWWRTAAMLALAAMALVAARSFFVQPGLLLAG
jgi:hypothetical protein